MRVEEAVRRLGRQQQGLVSAADLATLVPRSSTSRALAAGRLVQVRPRVYALEPLRAVSAQAGVGTATGAGVDEAWVAHVRAAVLSVAGSAATGRTAAALRGWELLVPPGRTVELAVVHGRSRADGRWLRVRQVRGLVVHRVVALPGTVPVPVVEPVSDVLASCLRLPLLEAVVLCDSALRARAASVLELRRAAARLPGVRDAAVVRRVLSLVDPRSGSVLESVLRVQLVLAGVVGFVTQHVIGDVDGHVLRADFCFVAEWLVVEVDGARWHRDPDRDRRTDNRLAALGWRVLRFTWAEVVHEPAEVVRQIAAAVAAGQQTSGSPTSTASAA